MRDELLKLGGRVFDRAPFIVLSSWLGAEIRSLQSLARRFRVHILCNVCMCVCVYVCS